MHIRCFLKIKFTHHVGCVKIFAVVLGGNEKATLRARLRVALKFLKLTTFANEILWWAHRDSNPGPTD